MFSTIAYLDRITTVQISLKYFYLAFHSDVSSVVSAVCVTLSLKCDFFRFTSLVRKKKFLTKLKSALLANFPEVISA